MDPPTEAAGDESGSETGRSGDHDPIPPPLPPRFVADSFSQVANAARAPRSSHGVVSRDVEVGSGFAGGRQGPPVPELRRLRTAGGCRGIPRWAVRGHQPLRHPRQTHHHHAQGHPTRAPHPWGARVGRHSATLFRSSIIASCSECWFLALCSTTCVLCRSLAMCWCYVSIWRNAMEMI
jgi:hypothetical protein